MTGSAGVVPSLDGARVAVVERLLARRAEIEAAVFESVGDVASGTLAEAPVTYVEGLRAAVLAIVELALTVIATGDANAPIPHAAIAQARRAARIGVTLDTVLRRYIAGSGRLTEFIIEETHRTEFATTDAELRHELHRSQQELLNRVVAAITDAYQVEADCKHGSREQRKAALVRRLLAGERLLPAELVDLEYPLYRWHVGVIATGPDTVEALESMKANLGCTLLSVPIEHEVRWAWLGDSHRLRLSGLELLAGGRYDGIRVACGAPHKDVDGWRLTHREAQAALLIASRRPPGVTWCPAVALEAAVIQDDTLAASLEATFVRPLDGFHSGVAVARETLRAYFDTNCNVTRAAKQLKVVRNTVISRLKEIEELQGRSLHTCHSQLEIALRIAELRDSSIAPPGASESRPVSSTHPDPNGMLNTATGDVSICGGQNGTRGSDH